MLNTLFDLALVLVGFSSIILVHELGHFLAARWAGIRVMAFAMGFGPALVSYRKGLGVRAGSSEREYLKRLEELDQRVLRESGPQGGAMPAHSGPISPTEYRLNLLPLGGYVRMLGQDDADPTAVSDAPDSFQSAPVWKRMVVISAGVVCNVVLAGVLFVVVFSRGLLVDRPVVGEVAPESPAAAAVAANARDLAVTEPGLRPGDEILAVNGRPVISFHRLTIEAALARRGTRLQLDVRRDGVYEPLRFEIEPAEQASSRRLELGITPAVSPVVDGDGLSDADFAPVRERLAALGLAGIKPGMLLVAVGDRRDDAGISPYAIDRAANTGKGAPVPVRFAAPGKNGAGDIVAELRPRAALQVAAFAAPGGKDGQVLTTAHLLGLTPVMMVERLSKEGEASGLKPGDLFAQLGDLAWPSAVEGIAEVRRGDRTSIHVVVSRAAPAASGGAPADTRQLVDLGEVKVVKGRIGFYPGHSAFDSNVLARWPRLAAAKVPGVPEVDQRTGGSAPTMPPGTRLLAVNGVPTPTLADAREALRAALASTSPGPERAERTVMLEVLPPVPVPGPTSDGAQAPSVVRVAWAIGAAEQERLAALRWVSPLGAGLFEPAQTLHRGSGALEAIAIGMEETRYAMLSTYITLARLVQGTVKVEHLNGPVGIAHVGTLLADRGIIWLLFFMAVVSVNLAVINFLPVPIVDGGHMVYLFYELFTGKRVSVMVQNVATMAGLVLVGTAFLVVTYNDLARLLWR